MHEKRLVARLEDRHEAQTRSYDDRAEAERRQLHDRLDSDAKKRKFEQAKPRCYRCGGQNHYATSCEARCVGCGMTGTTKHADNCRNVAKEDKGERSSADKGERSSAYKGKNEDRYKSGYKGSKKDSWSKKDVRYKKDDRDRKDESKHEAGQKNGSGRE